MTTDNETQRIVPKNPELNRLICADQSRARLEVESGGYLEILTNVNHLRLNRWITVHNGSNRGRNVHLRSAIIHSFFRQA